ncbi:MAG TPA: hypothetical protein VJ647_02735 [Chitinophagaceae bacterium]|nr:hypothetical protein [Chitinophagaceae bacterium]
MNANTPAPVQLNDIEEKIIRYCSGKPRGVKELAEILSIGHSSGDMKRAVSRLLQLKLIEYMVPEFYRSYSQRYRTTIKGKEYLKNGSSAT